MPLTLIREDRHFWDPDGYSEEPIGTEAVYVLTVDNDRYEFPDAAAAHRAMDIVDVEIRAGRSVFPCSWLVERFHPEPDSPADLVGPCGAPSFEEADGWSCLAGHEHRSSAEYYDEEEVVRLVRGGYSLASDALLMDGRPVEAAL